MALRRWEENPSPISFVSSSASPAAQGRHSRRIGDAVRRGRRACGLGRRCGVSAGELRVGDGQDGAHGSRAASATGATDQLRRMLSKPSACPVILNPVGLLFNTIDSLPCTASVPPRYCLCCGIHCAVFRHVVTASQPSPAAVRAPALTHKQQLMYDQVGGGRQARRAARAPPETPATRRRRQKGDSRAQGRRDSQDEDAAREA
jgi:hypothetical protein